MKYEYVVLAMDTLINNPEVINPRSDTPRIADNLVIPVHYLDTFYQEYKEQSTKGDSARECMKILNNHMMASKDNEKLKLSNGSILSIKSIKKKSFADLNPDSAGHQAIALAKSLVETDETLLNKIAVMTGSNRLMPIIRHHKIDVKEIAQEPYTGRRVLYLPDEFTNEWYSNNKLSAETFAEIFPNEAPLRVNEFVEFQAKSGHPDNHSYKNIGRLDPYQGQLVPLKYFKNLPDYIYPRSSGQAMLAELLMAPPDEVSVVIVRGPFGCGKTFLTLAAGQTQTKRQGKKEPTYDRIFICPRDSFLGREHGYLPGSLPEKLNPLVGPIKDQLREIIKKRGPNESKYSNKKKKKDRGNDIEAVMDNKQIDEEVEKQLMDFNIEALINMGGRNISNSFIILDEFQDMERGQAKAVLTRIGNGSKMVIMGDPSQFTNPHLSPTSNGLSYAANLFGKFEGAGIITLLPSENERSEAARAISAIFDS